MQSRFWRRLITTGAILASAAVLLGTGTASAATTGTAPHWFTGQVNQDRITGSETTYYIMAAAFSLFQQSSIFGCTLETSDYRTCNTSADQAVTDTQDDYDRNEMINGEGIGSSGGIGQLCGTKPTGGLTVDFARSSRPKSSSDCSDATFLGFSKDSVTGLVFPFANTATINCPSGDTCSTQVGPVTAGWRPGDPLAGPYSGVPFNSLSNQVVSGIGNNESIAYRMYCDTTSNAISDWGQVTDRAVDPNTGKTLGSEGLGAKIGAPVYIPFINTNSGTYSVWKTFVGCDTNGKAGADGQTAQENDGAEMARIAAADHPNDPVGAGNQLAESLYYISYGVQAWHAYTLGGGKITRINNVGASPSAALTGSIATARTLFMVYRPSTLRASVADFLNWFCDTDPADANHGVDLTTGANYSQELSNMLDTTFVFPRVPCTTDANGNSVPPITSANPPVSLTS